MRIHRFSVLCALFFLPGISAYAQAKTLEKGLKSLTTKNTAEKVKTVLGGPVKAKTPSLRQAVRPLDEKTLSSAAAANIASQIKSAAQKRKETWAFTKQMTQSVFFLHPTMPHNTRGTGFLFKTQYKGKTEVWGIMAAHVAQSVSPNITASLFKEGQAFQIQGRIAQEGHFNGLDAVLIKFYATPDFLNAAIPLPLATSPAQIKNRTTSYGYAVETVEFIPARNRRVLEVSPNIITTSYVFKPHKRKGACGSPLLNEQNEVVGMHIGSSTEDFYLTPPPSYIPASGQNLWQSGRTPFLLDTPKTRISHAIPTERMLDLVRAFHNNGVQLRPVIWNGLKIMDLNVNQVIRRVVAKKNNQRIRAITSDTIEPFLDESKLNEFVYAPNATDLMIEVETYQYATRQLSREHFNVNLLNGSITKQTLYP